MRRALVDVDWLRAYDGVRMGDDWFVSFCPMVRARSFACLTKPLYEYRMHGNSLTDAYDYSYPNTVLSMHGCKMDLARSDLGACLSEGLIETSTLVELAGAVAFIPACPTDYTRYTQTLDKVRTLDLFVELLFRRLSSVPVLYRIPLELLRSQRYRVLFCIKRLASAVRRRHVGAHRLPDTSRLISRSPVRAFFHLESGWQARPRCLLLDGSNGLSPLRRNPFST